MGDISKIKLTPTGDEYDIKDATARQTAANAIPSSQKGAINGVAELGSDGKVLSSQLPLISEYTIYNSVSELGLTVGSATILSAYNAMGLNSILICPIGDFASSEAPVDNGSAITLATVEIVRANANGRGYIYCHGKTSSIPDFRMNLLSSNPPDGNWVCLTPRKTTYSLSVNVTGATIGSRVANQFNSLPTGVTVSDVKSVYVSKVTDSSAAHVTPMFASDGRLMMCVYAAKATVSADVEVTIVY